METPITITGQSSLFSRLSSGTPICPLCRLPQQFPCWQHKCFRRWAVTPCLPASTQRTKPCPRVCSACYTGYERGTEVHTAQRKCEAVEIAHGTGRGTAIVYTATKKAGVNDGQFI
jgi:hypothetical protein